MNKKFMSFVLAMLLSAGLGVSAFAYSYTGGTKEAKSFRVDVQDMASLAGNIKTTGYDGSEETVKAANDVTSRICAVFNYTAGMVVSSVDADRNITIYDQGRYRATLGYNDDGTYTITGFAVYGSDYSKIQNCGGLKNFLLEMGVSESALKCSKTQTDADGTTYFVGENGEKLTEKDIESGKSAAQVDVDWLSQAEAQLAKGINHSITINFTAQYGASVTFSVNGKQLETIAYDGTQIAQFNYNAAGTLETIDQLTYDTDFSDNEDSGTGANTNRQKGVIYKATHSTIHCDEWGRQSYVTNAEGTVTGRYSYSSNGSMTSSYDAASNSITYYTGGKASFVMNDAGFVTTRYFYHENGSLDGVMTYNYDQDKGTTQATSMTAYRWGNVIGSANLADIQPGQPQTFDQLRAAVDYIKANPEAALQSLKDGSELTDEEKAEIQGIKFADISDEDSEYNDEAREKYNKIMSKNTSTFGNITSIALYESDMKNTTLLSKFGVNSNDITNMLRMSNGYSSVGNMGITIDVLDFETETVNGGTNTEKVTKNTEAGDSSHARGAFLRSSTNVDSKTTRNGMVGQQLKVTLTVMDHGGQSYQANCTPVVLRDPVNQIITKTTTVTNQYSNDPVVTGTMETDPAKLQQIADSLGVKPENVSIGEDGVITVKNEDGSTSRYVAIKDAEINMMEGSGFLGLEDGETMLVDIGDMDVSSIKEGDKIMFMGDVNYTSNGTLAIKMNTSYGGGFKNFGSDSDAMKAEMARIEGVANGSIAPAADGSDQWIIDNTATNSAKLGKMIQNLNKDTVSLDDLREAWNKLLF